MARKERQEFASNIDVIDCLPPGLYEAVLTQVEGARSGLGAYIARFEARTLDDIRSVGCNDLDDERKFAAAARLSEVNLGLYRTFVQPWVRATATESGAELLRQLNPARLQFELFSDKKNPFMRPVAAMAEWARAHRRTAAHDNPFLAWQKFLSSQIEVGLDAYRDWRDGLQEAMFHATYGSPLVQALLGLRASDDPPRRRPGREPEEQAFIERRIEALRCDMAKGGLREALVRALLYVGLPAKAVDERGFAVIRQIRSEQERALPLPAFKALIRDQFLMLLIDEEWAITTMPELVKREAAEASRAFALIEQVARARGRLEEEAETRLERVRAIFGTGDTASGKPAQRRPSLAEAAAE